MEATAKFGWDLLDGKKITVRSESHDLKMILNGLAVENGDFHSHVSLPEATWSIIPEIVSGW
jgi:hypothetical protein